MKEKNELENVGGDNSSVSRTSVYALGLDSDC
jgi:hypothetical protein